MCDKKFNSVITGATYFVENQPILSSFTTVKLYTFLYIVKTGTTHDRFTYGREKIWGAKSGYW